MADDLSELYSLAADLTNAPAEVRPFVRKAMQVTAFKVRDDWREGADRTGLGGYAADITYETRELAESVVAEIGPTVGDSGSFGLVEEARGNVRSAPQHAGRDALERNEDDFATGMEKALFDGLSKAVGR